MSDEGKNIDDLIRDGFTSSESHFDFGSWDQVAKSLDGEKNTLDNLLQSAYPSVPAEVPNEGWEAVHTQLDIDTVWNRINGKLTNKKRFIYFWRVAGVAALLLALIYVLIPSQNRLEPTSRNLIGLTFDEKHLASDNLNGTSMIEMEENQIAENGSLEQHSISNPLTTNVSISGGEITESSTGFIETTQQSTSIAQASTNEINNSNDDKVIIEKNDQEHPEISLVERWNLNSISAISYGVGPHQPLVELEKHVSPKRNHWEIGAGLELQHLFIDDANTSEALSANSNTQLGFNLNPVWSVQGRYVWNDKHFAEIKIAPWYLSKHRLFKYEKLTRVERLTEFDMSSASIGYGRLFQIVPHNESHQLLAQISADATYIWSENLYRSGVLIDNQLGVNEWNVGIGVTLGYKKSFGQFYIMPSWKTSFGLNDHLKNSSFSSKRLVTNGVSINLGIKL